MGNKAISKRADDVQIKKLNWVGLSLAAIGRRVDSHEATISNRLKKLGITPNDTRRSFMEVVFEKMTTEQQEWLMDHLFVNQIPVQEFVAELIKKAHLEAPAPLVPEKTELPPMLPLPEELPVNTGNPIFDAFENLVNDGTAVVKVTPEKTEVVPLDSLFVE